MLNKLKHLITIYNFCVCITVLTLAGVPAYAERNYTYVLTVGMDANDPNTNYNTINAAIVATNAKSPPLASDRLGVIRVYDGTYVEQLNSSQGGNDLPAHCDLIGMGMAIGDVKIYHAAIGNMYVPGVNCVNDNVVSHLEINNYLSGGPYCQNNIYFRGDGTLDNCILFSYHGPAVRGYGHLIVKGSKTEISAPFMACIWAESTFEIYDCTLKPYTFSPVGETPGGINARGSGIIDGVTISCPYGFTKEYGTTLTGINVSISDDEHVMILNTKINLHLKSEYCAAIPQPSYSSVIGINAAGWDGSRGGYVLVEDCNIIVQGVEDVNVISDPCDDGHALYVEGINGIREDGVGVVEIAGNTSIHTSRSRGSYAGNGHEYLLMNTGSNVTMAVDFNTVTFDPNGSGEPNEYDPNYVYGMVIQLVRARNITQDANYLWIQDAIDYADTNDVIEVSKSCHFENLDFGGKAITLRNSDPNDFETIKRTIIDGDDANEAVLFDSGEGASSVLTGLTIRNAMYGIRCLNSSSPSISRCIIRDTAYGIDCNSSSPSIKNSWIYDNKDGIFLENSSCTPEVWNNTIVDNDGNGVYATAGADPNIVNCILWNNIDDLHNCSATYSCIKNVNDAGGTGNITNDPCFVNTSAHDYHLDSESSCIDAGDPNGNYTGQTDIDGNPRRSDVTGEVKDISKVDIGADEAATYSHVHNVTRDKWYLGINLAISKANNGDEIVVYPGTYTENVDVGLAITLRSTDPCNWDVVKATVIKGHITINGAEEADISGFTIDGQYGGSSYCVGGTPSGTKVSNCIMKSFIASGVYFFSGTAIVKNNIIANEDSGICFESMSNSLILDNLIYNCEFGIGVNEVNTIIRNNAVVNNYVFGVYGYGESPSVISNCIVWNNGDDLYNCAATYSCIKDVNDANGTGNISDDPLFFDPDANNFHLTSDSPCINAGDPCGIYPNEQDIDNESRVLDGRVDIGADEYYWSPADYDKNGIVAFADYAVFAHAWQTNDANISLDGDNDVDIDDLSIFCRDWLWQPSWLSGEQMMFAQQSQSSFFAVPENETFKETSDAESLSLEIAATAEKSIDVNELADWLEQLWLEDAEIRATNTPEEWQQFIDNLRSGQYQ